MFEIEPRNRMVLEFVELSCSSFWDVLVLNTSGAIPKSGAIPTSGTISTSKTIPTSRTMPNYGTIPSPGCLSLTYSFPLHTYSILLKAQ